MSLIARLGVVLGLNSTEFIKGIDDATKKTKEFEYNQRKQIRLAEKATQDMMTMASRAAMGMAGLGYLVGQAFSKADEITDTAKAFNITVDSLISTQGALQAAGGEANNVTTLFSKLASVQEDARNGSDALRLSFTKLGISGKDVDKLSLDEMFKRVATELAKVEDETKRTALAQDLLGKAAKGVDWGGFVDEYKKFSDPSLIAAINENAKAWDNIEKAMKSIGHIIQLMVAPFAAVVNSAADLFKTWNSIKEGGDASVDWGAAMGGMPGEEGATTEHVGKGKPAFSPIAKPASTGSYKEASEKEKAAAKRAADELKRLLDRKAKFNAELKYGEQIQQEKIGAYFQEYYLNLDLLALEADKYKISIDEYNQRKLIIEQAEKLNEIQRSAEAAKITALRDFEKASTEDKEFAEKLYKQKIKNIEELTSLQLASTRETNAAERKNFDDSFERQYSFIEGWKSAFREYAVESEKNFNVGQKSFGIAMNTMEDAINQFARTGKLAFSDLVGSMLKEMIALQLKMQASQLFGFLKNAIGIVDVGAMGAGSSSTLEGFSAMQYPGMATGGRIDGPTIVGENGPELLIPNRPGTIIPNGAWQAQVSSGGGTTINGPYIASMNAIDTQSGIQFLAKNKDTIWASYQSANRGIPVTR